MIVKHLAIQDLRLSLDGFRLEVDDICLPVGKIVTLTGESGAGKTLLLETLGLLRAPTSSRHFKYETNEAGLQDLKALWSFGPRSAQLAQTRGALFGFVPQIGGLLPFLTAKENIALPPALLNRADSAWCDYLIARLDLKDQAHLMPAQLSVGQRQRTAIARALAHRPAFVIADEPTAALDPHRSKEVLALFFEVVKDAGCGVLLSTHEVDRIRAHDLTTWHLVVSKQADTVVSKLEVAA
ncbi:MAG: ATP-binding cassette domain-containing protein [Pseudomonadota bacterium]